LTDARSQRDIRLDRILQSLPRVVDFQTKHAGHMTTGSDFKGDFIARDAKAARAGRFSTTGLSRLSDFATAMKKLQGE
jgi:hypothetical protein